MGLSLPLHSHDQDLFGTTIDLDAVSPRFHHLGISIVEALRWV